MSYQTILQPNGKLAVWSTVVDDFIAQDLTPEGVVEVYARGDRRACAMNLAFCWSKLPKVKQDEEVEKFMREASDGILEQAQEVLTGKPREGDWLWSEAIEIVRECHGKAVMKERMR